MAHQLFHDAQKVEPRVVGSSNPKQNLMEREGTVPPEDRLLLRENILKQNASVEHSPLPSTAKSALQHTPNQDSQSPSAHTPPLAFTHNQTQFLVTTIIHLNQQLMHLARRMEDLEGRLAAAEQSNPQTRRKKTRRKAQEIDRSFRCPYSGCQKCYGSEVSLNLHVKLKHPCKQESEQQPAERRQVVGPSAERTKFSLPPQFLQSIQQEYQMLNRKLKPH